MKIVQICGSAAGGVRAHLADVLRVLQDEDLALLAPAPVLAAVNRAGVAPARSEAISLADRPSRADTATLRTIRRYARGADIVHAHTLRAGAYAALALTGLSRPPRLVVTAHNLPQGGTAVRKIGDQLARIVARRAAVVFAVSPDIAAWMRRFGAQARLAIIPARRLSAAKTLPQASGSPLLVTVARLSYQKGLDRLLHSAAELKCAFPHLSWLVVGGGPLAGELAAQIHREQLPVRLCGEVDNIAGYFAIADMVVQTARWEGQPVALQEAIHAGCAIVATDVGGTQLVLGEEIRAVDPKQLTGAIAALLRDHRALAERRAAAKRRSATLPQLADLRAQLHETFANLKE